MSIFSKWRLVLNTIIGVLLLILIVRIWWIGGAPSIPKNMPHNSVWIEPPPAPFEGARGYWLGCWSDIREDSVRCQLTDLKGKSLFQDVFLAYNDPRRVISEQALVLKKGYTTDSLIFREEETIPLVHLRDGTILIPSSKYEEVKQILDRRLR